MLTWLVFLPILVFALFEGVFLSLNLVLLTVLTWSICHSLERSALVAFLAGLLLDLAKGSPLGLSSLLFLGFCGLILAYRRRFDPFHPLFLPLFVFISASFYQLVMVGFFHWSKSLLLALLAFLLWLLLKFGFKWGQPKLGLRL